MWSSKILNSTYTGPTLHVTVYYTNGNKEFSEEIDMTGGTLDVLSQKVQGRLDTLEATEAFNNHIVTGDFTPTLPVEDAETVAIAKLRELKQLVDLGVINSTDQQFTDALQTAQAANATPEIATPEIAAPGIEGPVKI